MKKFLFRIKYFFDFQKEEVENFTINWAIELLTFENDFKLIGGLYKALLQVFDKIIFSCT